jgi:teichuronic acid biosynthesis glycosyltransferase TuaH
VRRGEPQRRAARALRPGRPAGSLLSGDAVVYGAAGWDGPWLTEHQLARALARRGRVLFVEPPRSLLSPLRGRALPRERLRSRDGVTVLRTLALPPVGHPRARRLSRPWVSRQVAAAVRELGLQPRFALAARSEDAAAPFVVSLVKDWLQAGGHLTGQDAADLRRRELAAWRSADLVCAISHRLQVRLAEDGIDSALLRHGFDATSAPGFEQGAEPPELAGLGRPVLGATGRIDARWAFTDLERLADRFPEGSVVLVGPVHPGLSDPAFTRLLARPNVHRFPAVPNTELPRWLSRFDSTLVPYTDDEWQFYASPIKVWDYFYAGAPIVATGAPALGEFPDGLVHFALSPSSLPELVSAALAEDRGAGLARRREYALANTWDHRAGELEALVQRASADASPAAAASRSR